MSKQQPVKKELCVIQFESEDFYRAVADQILYTVGLEITESARNKKQAAQLLEKIQQQKLKPDLAIIDTILETDHSEGEIIATKLRELSPQTKIIAYTIMDDTPWGDYLAIKSNRIPDHTLIRGLSELFALQFIPAGTRDTEE